MFSIYILKNVGLSEFFFQLQPCVYKLKGVKVPLAFPKNDQVLNFIITFYNDIQDTIHIYTHIYICIYIVLYNLYYSTKL